MTLCVIASKVPMGHIKSVNGQHVWLTSARRCTHLQLFINTHVTAARSHIYTSVVHREKSFKQYKNETKSKQDLYCQSEEHRFVNDNICTLDSIHI